MSDINEEWYDFSATVKLYTYQVPTAVQEENGITATIVTGSVEVFMPGAGCPDGHVFGDYSVVQATSLNPTTKEDKSKMRKDDKVGKKDLLGNAENEWHQGVREDFNKVPTTDYKNRKVYINMRWDFNSQLEEIKKDKERASPRIRKIKPSKRPDWINKAYGGK